MRTIKYKYLFINRSYCTLFLPILSLTNLTALFFISTLALFSPACTTAFQPENPCGNGIREKGEECDDHNTQNGDGCSDKCEVEDGWSCLGDNCLSICGDGRKVGDEECDDGELSNLNNGSSKPDGCTNECRIDLGWKCMPSDPSNPTSKSVCNPASWHKNDNGGLGGDN